MFNDIFVLWENKEPFRTIQKSYIENDPVYHVSRLLKSLDIPLIKLKCEYCNSIHLIDFTNYLSFDSLFNYTLEIIPNKSNNTLKININFICDECKKIINCRFECDIIEYDEHINFLMNFGNGEIQHNVEIKVSYPIGF